MFKKSIVLITLLLNLLLVPSALAADKAKKYDENASWKSVVKVKYKRGMKWRVDQIIHQYFIPSSKKAKTPEPEIVYELKTGPYDRIVVWHLYDGLEDLSWKMHPNWIKWREALNELAGSKEKAHEILVEFNSLIVDEVRELAIVEK